MQRATKKAAANCTILVDIPAVVLPVGVDAVGAVLVVAVVAVLAEVQSSESTCWMKNPPPEDDDDDDDESEGGCGARCGSCGDGGCQPNPW